MILVSEAVEHSPSAEPEWDRGLEMSDPDTTQDVLSALKSFVDDVSVIPGPQNLMPVDGKRPLVMTIYGGAGSRNRMALVPAVCEAFSLPFMGADAYARVICQDKYLSKQIAREFSLESSPAVLIRSCDDLLLIRGLAQHLVVKPNLEGSSIGIGARNLVHGHGAAMALADELLTRLEQPILVEEFMPGREVSFCISGTAREVNFLEAIEDVNRTQSHFFSDKLYTADLKQNSWRDMGHEHVTSEISPSLRANLTRLFHGLGKLDYIRIDCRIEDGRCQLVELTPDPFLAVDGSFGQAFEMSGLGYAVGLRRLVENSIDPR